MTAAPQNDIDLYSDEGILNPYGFYRALRDTGPVVELTRSGVHVLSRYEGVVNALRDHGLFSSASGISISDKTNAVAIGTLISSDPPEHDELRRPVAAPLSPTSMKELRPRIEETARELVDGLIERERFDAVADLAEILPVAIVSRLVGLPEQGRENMLIWAGATFDLFGPDNDRSEKAWPAVREMREYAASVARRGAVVPGGWADGLIDLADRGMVPHERLPMLFRDYMAPSLDTTIFATASLMYLLGTNPDQWELLKDDPSLVKNTINEAIRLESPIRGFSRRVMRDCEVGGVSLAAGTQVLLLYGSANRDERKWDDPERFDIRRRVGDHIGFGFGVHSCAGMHLARLEIESILKAMLDRVKSLSVGPPVWALNNTLRGLAGMTMRFERR